MTGNHEETAAKAADETTQEAAEPGSGAHEFTDPEGAASRIAAITHYYEVLLDLYNGKIETHFDMSGWIHEKASALAQAATDLANLESPPPAPRPLEWTSPTGHPWITDTRTCPFCGGARLRIRSNDNNQRVDAYCENTSCDARDLVVLVLNDGHAGLAMRRNDVRRLKG